MGVSKFTSAARSLVVSFGRLVLSLAAASLLLAAPAQAQFSEGYKFLEAVKKKNGEEVESMLGKPGTTLVNTRDATTGETALHIVTARRDTTWISYLIAKGANVNARDGRGVTPLMLACNLGFQDGVEVLIANRARVDEPTATGETPLITAVHRRDLGMMRALLQAGADPDRADNSGRSARDYAMLDGKGSQLVSTIEANAKSRQQRQSTYGPSF